jgi:hypothetical protein
MKDSEPPCVRCKKRGLSCTVNKSLQMILEDDASYALLYLSEDANALTRLAAGSIR